MKLEETTVTRQSIRPKMPTIMMPATAQQPSGIATQRALRKIRPSAKIISATTAKLKVLRSPRTKVTRSSAIMGAPPR